MSITMRALTSSSDDEIIQCLITLRDTTAGNSGSYGIGLEEHLILSAQVQNLCTRASTSTTQAILPGHGSRGPTHSSETLS
jgi:hypothetical protein